MAARVALRAVLLAVLGLSVCSAQAQRVKVGGVDATAADLIKPGSIILETEDFNYTDEAGNAGLYIEGNRTVGGEYQLLTATKGIDYNDGNSDGNARRPDVTVSMNTIGGNNDRGIYVVSQAFKAGWNDNGDWRNYTQKFPDAPTVYDVYGNMSSGGSDNHLTLSLVVDGAKTDTQKVAKLGNFDGPASGGWDTMVFTGLSNDGGATKAKVVLKGESTLRITTVGGNNDQDYIVLVPDPATTSVAAAADISPLAGTEAPTVDPIAVHASLLENSFAISDASISVKLDGAVVASTITRTGRLIEVDANVGPFADSVRHFIEVGYTENGVAKKLTSYLAPKGAITHRYYESLTDFANTGGIYTFMDDVRWLVGDADLQDTLSSMKNPEDNRAEQFISHFFGYFTPSESGNYNFYTASDDQSILWLSTDEDPANKVKIAEESGCCNAWQPPGAAQTSVAIPLVAGKKYFIEGSMHEIGGGDWFRATWTKNGAAVNDSQPAIGEGLSAFVGTKFDLQPKSQTLAKGRKLELKAHALSDKWIALGTPAISYQWYRNGTAIDGATGGSYTIDAVSMGDNGAVFTVKVSDTQGAKPVLATSAAATITVQDDTTAAKITSVLFDSPRSAVVNFDEEVTNPGAAVFTADGGTTIDSMSGSGKSWSVHFAASVPEGASRVITATGFTDLAGNTGVASGTGKLLFTSGLLKHEHYSGNSGGNNIDTTVYANPIFPNSPTWTAYLGRVDVPQTANPNEENFTTRITAFISPVVSGSYYFFTRSDDASRINLSTDDDPANKVDIADETGCCNGFYEPGDDASTSAAIALEAGKKYYIEILQQEGGGGDFVQVASRKDDGAAGAFPLLGSNQDVMITSVILDPATVSVAIGSNPADASVEAGNTVTLSASASSTPAGLPVSWQWQKKAASDAGYSDIAGATGASFTTKRLGLGDSGIKYRVVATSVGQSATSTAATVTVTAGAPAGVSSIGAILNASSGKSEIGVVFDSPVNLATAVVAANYTVSGATVDSVSYVDGANAAILKLGSALTAGANVTVSVAGVTDFSGNVVAGSKTFKVSKFSYAGIGGNEVPANIPSAYPVGDGGFDVLNGGVGFWADYDETTFVYEKVTGDFDRQVRVAYHEPASNWARGGLVLRHDLSDMGKARPTAENGNQFTTYVSFHVNPTTKGTGGGANNSHEINHRTQLGGQTSGTGPNPNAAPPYPNAWLRVKRTDVSDANPDGLIEFFRRSAADAAWIKVAEKKLTDWDPALSGEAYFGPNYGAEVNNDGGSTTHGNYLIKFRDYGCGPDDHSCDVVPPPTPTLSASLVNGKLHIVFANGTLQRSDKVGAGAVWTDVGTTSPVDVGAGFYRVKGN